MKNNKKPRLRFKGFNDDWEQRKLGDIVTITMGQSPEGKTYSNTPTKYILIGSILEHGQLKRQKCAMLEI